MLAAEDSVTTGQNDPRAKWMALIGFINFNMVMACIFGTFSVLLAAVETRLHVSLKLATMGIPAVTLVTALTAPVVGALAARYSLRVLMVAGACLSTAGFVLLAFSHDFVFYLVAYGLLIGTGMAVAVILPNTLVTRWFVVNRGRALGLMSMSIFMAIMPLVANAVLLKFGLTVTYMMLAGCSLVCVVVNLFVIDKPAGYDPQAAVAQHAVAGMSMAQLMRTPLFWGLMFAFIASSMGSIVLGAHMVPMAGSWGISATLGAALLGTMSLVGIAGTVIYGWVADRLGGPVTIALVVLIPAVLWMLLLVHPPFLLAAVLIGMIGLNGAGVVPVFSFALSEAFGRESFSRAYGLANLLNLPFSVLCVPAAAVVFTRTGSYNGVLIAEAVFLALTGLVALSMRGRRAPRVPAPVLAE